MKNDLTTWQQRVAERSDLCTFLTHFTKPRSLEGSMASAMDVLFEILSTTTLKGSTTKTGFIVGDTPAVCFQESPPTSLAQNLYFEQKISDSTTDSKWRYSPLGVMFFKTTVYRSGGRPVIYEKTETAKDFLPSDEWWRIVKLDHSDSNKIIDWTHEREWRVPHHYKFELKDATVVLLRSDYKEFIKRATQQGMLSEIAGILTLNSSLV